MNQSNINKENFSQVSNSRAQSIIHAALLDKSPARPSKSTEKPRKGISRVSTMVNEHKESKQPKQTIESQIKEEIIFIRPQFGSARPSACSTIQFDNTQKLNKFESQQCSMQKPKIPTQLIERMRLMEEEQVVMEKEIMELENKCRFFQNRSRQFEEKYNNQRAVNRNLELKFNEQRRFINLSWEERSRQWQNRFVGLESIVKQKEEAIKTEKAKIEEERMKQAHSQKFIEQNKSTIHYLESILKSLREEKAASQSQIDELKLKNERLTRQLMNVEEKFKKLQQKQEGKQKTTIEDVNQEKIQLHEKYRQLMIKNSTLDQEKKSLEYKITQLKEQIYQQQKQNEKLSLFVKELSTNLEQQDKQMEYFRLYAPKLDRLSALEEENKDLYSKNEEYCHIITELETKRSKQIEYHQEQIKRVKNQQIKYDKINQERQEEEIRKLKIEKNQLIDEMRLVKNKKEEMMREMANDYEKVIQELKQKMLEKQKYLYEIESLLQKSKAQKQILQVQLSKLKEDNELLIEKYKDRYRSRSTQRADQVRNIMHDTQYNQSNKNQEVGRKISNYEMEIIKLQDKIKVYEINREQSEGLVSEYERKIKHFTEQISHIRFEKEKLIKDKVELAEELRNIKSEIMGKENKISKLTFILKEKDQEFAQIATELNRKNTQFMDYERNYISLKNERNQLFEENAILADRHNAHLKTTELFKKDVRQKELTIEKYKESLELLKKQITLKENEPKIKNEKGRQGERYAIYEEIAKVTGDLFEYHTDEIQYLKKWYKKTYEQTRTLEEHDKKFRQYEKAIYEANRKKQNPELLLKCKEYEEILVRMEESHKKRLEQIKVDYDVVYEKYLKYRNMSIVLHKTHR